MSARAWVAGSFAGALLTLPWVGVGVMHLATGRDLGGGLQPSWILMALAMVLSIARPAGPAGTVARPAALLAAAAGGALGTSFLGLLLAPAAPSLADAAFRYGKQVVQLAIMAVFLIWPALWVRGDRRWRWTARWLVAGALLQAAYGLVQEIDWYWPGPLLPALESVFTSNPAILSGSEQLHLGDALRDVPRLRGTACEPLYLGNYLLVVLPLLPLTGWGRRSRAATGVVLGLLLVLTWSRGAWLAGLAAVILAAALSGVRPGRPWFAARRWLPPLLVLALVLAVLGPERMLLPIGRLAQSFSERDWSNLTRLYSMQAAWRAFLLSPVVGVGWGQFGWHFPLLVDAAGLQSQFTWPVVNCFPLQILCETGVTGFAVFVTVTALMAREVLRRRRDPVGGPRVIACAVATAGVWLQLLTFSQYNLPHIWLAPGLLLAALADTSPTDERGGAA